MCVVECAEKGNEDDDDEDEDDGDSISGSGDGSISHNSIKWKGIGRVNVLNKDEDRGEGERGIGDRVDTAPYRNGSGEKRSGQTESEGNSRKNGRDYGWEGRGESGSFSFSAAKVTFLLYYPPYISHVL